MSELTYSLVAGRTYVKSVIGGGDGTMKDVTTLGFALLGLLARGACSGCRRPGTSPPRIARAP